MGKSYPVHLENVPFSPNPLRWRHYDERIVVFLDVLGFTTLVDLSREHPLLVDQLCTSLEYVTRLIPSWTDPEVESKMVPEGISHGLREQDARRLLQVRQRRDRLTYFSDTVVLSSTADWPGVAWALFGATRMVLCLLQVGFPVRGGIVKGQLIHDPDVVFGPALVEAYHLESQRAGTPRIVIDASTADHLRSVGDPYGTGISPSHLLGTDVDGVAILHYLGKAAVDTAGLGQPHVLLSSIQSNIVKTLRSPKVGPDVRTKTIALARYFNESIQGDYPDVPQVPPNEMLEPG